MALRIRVRPLAAVVLTALVAAALLPGGTAADPPADALRVRPTANRYVDLNVFACGPVDAPHAAALPWRDGLRVRARIGPVTDPGTVVEATVLADGSVRLEHLPGYSPITLDLLDVEGHRLLSAHEGDTLRAGPSGELRCIGCHAGHSSLPVPPDDEGARWFNAAPSAQVTTSSHLAGSAGAGALIDLRTRGAPREVAWIAASPNGQWLKLRWPRPLEIRELTLHGLRPSRAGRVTVRTCEVVLRRNGNEISRRVVNAPLDPEGTHLGVGLTVADEIEIDLRRTTGLLFGRRAAALAEIEALARVP